MNIIESVQHLNESAYTGCKSGAKMLTTATVTLGCKSFLDAQAKSCYCGSAPTSNESKSGKANANGKDSSNSYTNNNNNNKNTNKNHKQQRNNEKPSDTYNTYPNNIRQEQRTRDDPPSYGWKDKRDL